MRANSGRTDYGAVEATRDEFSHFSSTERLVLLERGDAAYREKPSLATLRTSVRAAAIAQSEQSSNDHTELSQLVILSVACVMAAATAFMACSLVPLVESLRTAVGFSSFQVVGLSAAPVLLSSITAFAVNNFVYCSALWDVLAWSAMSLAIGSWVSACAIYGSPLEYLMCGQLFVAVTISMLSAVPAKITTFWLPRDKQGVASTVWVCSVLLGMALPFLVVPPLVGDDSETTHLGSFLLWRAVFITGVVAGVIGLRAGMVPNEGPERDEGRLYRQRATQELRQSVSELYSNGPLLGITVSISLALGAAYSFYIIVPFLLSAPPHSYTPLVAGRILWILAPLGILGVLLVRSPWFFNVHAVRRFKPGMLASIAGIAVWIVIFITAEERTNELGLALISGAVYTFAASLAYLGMHVTAEMAFPLPETVSAPVVAAVSSAIVGLCPVVTIMCTHPFVGEYASESASPTGFLLSYGCMFWVLLLCGSFACVLRVYHDDERRVVIDAHPKLVEHVADRVAADLAQARAFSELVIPMPERLMRDEYPELQQFDRPQRVSALPSQLLHSHGSQRRI